MPDAWEYREPDGRKAYPPTQAAGPVPRRPPQYDPEEHRRRLTPPAIPLDLGGPAPGFNPAAGPQPRQQFSQAQYVPPPPRYAPPQPPQRKNHTGLKVLTGIAGGFLLLIVIAVAASPSKPSASTTQAGAPAATAASAGAASSAPAAAPADTQPAGTVSELQALAAAQGYLGDGQGFSRQGLIDQLDSSSGNGFSVADATWAVDHSGANWDDQAVKCAKGYMSDGQGFSRQSLIEQMTSAYGSRFTQAQAEYAADKIGL